MSQGSDQGTADILIPVRNNYPGTRVLLECIYRHTEYPFHIYVIDNASTDETVYLGKIYTRNITVVRNRVNRGWEGAINQGIRLASNPYIVFLDSGVEVSHGWLGNMIAFLDTHPRIAAVGPLHSNRDDWQLVDRVRREIVPQMPRFFTEDLHERNRILQYHFQHAGILVDRILDFSCAAFKRRAIEETGPIENSIQRGGNAKYCRRLRKRGYVIGLALDTCIVLPDEGAQGSRTETRGKNGRMRVTEADTAIPEKSRPRSRRK
jgi:GT2 family glycosyltransferase